MRAVVTGGAGFIGSHVVDALLARGDEVHVVDSFATGSASEYPPRRRCTSSDIREPLDELFEESGPRPCFHLAAQADVRRLGRASRLRRRGERRRHDPSARGGATRRSAARLQLDGRRDLRRAHEPCAGGRRRASRSRRTARRSSAARSTSRPRTDSTGRAMSRFGSATSTARVRIRTARRASSRSSSACCAAGECAEDLRRRWADARLRLRRRRRAATLAAVGQAGGVFNIGTGIETSVIDLFEACRAVAGGEVRGRARAGSTPASAAERARRLAAKRELGWRPQTSLEEGLRATALRTPTRGARACRDVRRDSRRASGSSRRPRSSGRPRRTGA